MLKFALHLLALNVKICITLLQTSPTAASGQRWRKLFPVEDPLTAWMLWPDTVKVISTSQCGCIPLVQCWFGRAVTFEARALRSARSQAEAQLQRESPRGPVSHAGDSQEPRPQPSRTLQMQPMAQVTLEFDLSRAPVWLGVKAPSGITPSFADVAVSPVLPSQTGLHRSVGSCSASEEAYWSTRGVVGPIVCCTYILSLWIFITVIIDFVIQQCVCVCASQKNNDSARMNIAAQTVLDLISAASLQRFLSVLILEPPPSSRHRCFICVCLLCRWWLRRCICRAVTPGKTGLGLGVGLHTGGKCLRRSGLSSPIPSWTSWPAAGSIKHCV